MKNKNIILRGYPVAPGLIMAKIKILKNQAEIVDDYEVSDVNGEVKRFMNAVESAKLDLISARDRMKESIGDQYEDILEAQILALEDKSVIKKTVESIISSKRNADYVYKNIVTQIISSMSKIDDPYLKDRIYDINDILNRVLRKLKKRGERNLDSSDQTIIAADTITPSDTINLDRKFIVGIITEGGGATSHSSIMARAMNIPSVVNLKGLLSMIKENDTVIVNGNSGVVVIDPDESSVKTYRKRLEEYKAYAEELLRVKNEESVTIDGRTIDVSANVELIEEVDEVKKYGGKGIGLLRTEFLFLLENGFPSFEKQLDFYSKISDKLFPDSIIVRTVDIGGDKPIFVERREENPFLGYRGIRVSLGNEEIMKNQLRAVLKASKKGNIKIMLPMVSQVEEVIRTKAAVDEVKRELFNAQESFDKDIEVGIMVEVPSTAILAHEFAKYVDFFSLGTNDLTQYTLAVDRNNDRVNDIYDSLDPAVLMLIKMTIDAAHENNIWAGLCGEMAADPIAVPLLVGLGIDELSMAPVFIPEVKKIIREVSFEECKELAKTVFSMRSGATVRKYMKDVFAERFPNMHKYLQGDFDE
ncbi:MAG: phosphoenolpyruvate--protein phosphotransferase [bacterium]